MGKELDRFLGKDVEVDFVRRIDNYPKSETGTFVWEGAQFVVLRTVNDDDLEIEVALAKSEIAAIYELAPDDEGDVEDEFEVGELG